MVSTSDQDVCIWDSLTGKEIHRLKVDGESTVGFRRDFGRYVIARSFHFDVAESSRGTKTLRDTTSGKDIWTVEPHGDWNRDVPFMPVIAAVAFSPDGKADGGIHQFQESCEVCVGLTWKALGRVWGWIR